MTTRYTPEKLEHHLSYEIDMLNGSYGLITDITEILETSNASDQQKIIALNAVKETFCLHARALVEFFTKPKTKINSASNFANTYVSNKAPPDIERKLNNQIAHFMEGRSDLDTDKIQDSDRVTLLRWIGTELQRWMPLRDISYLAINIPGVRSAPLTIAALGPAGPTKSYYFY